MVSLSNDIFPTYDSLTVTVNLQYKPLFQTDLDICGELEIGLEFQPPQTLLLTVFGAHNLTQREDDRLPHPYVKIQIPGIQALYQTKVYIGPLTLILLVANLANTK